MPPSETSPDGVQPSLVLPPDLRASGADSLKGNLLSLLAEPTVQQLRVDAHRVRHIDVVGLQLLLAFVKACKRRSIDVSWVDASDALCTWTEASRTRTLLGL